MLLDLELESLPKKKIRASGRENNIRMAACTHVAASGQLTQIRYAN